MYCQYVALSIAKKTMMCLQLDIAQRKLLLNFRWCCYTMPFSRTQSVFIFMGKCIGERVSPFKRGFNTNYYFYVSLNGTLGKVYGLCMWVVVLFIIHNHASFITLQYIRPYRGLFTWIRSLAKWLRESVRIRARVYGTLHVCNKNTRRLVSSHGDFCIK